MNERFIRISYSVIFVIIAIISLITLGITASLVSKYNKDGYPPEHTGAYRDRIRLLLVASVWTTFFAREYEGARQRRPEPRPRARGPGGRGDAGDRNGGMNGRGRGRCGRSTTCAPLHDGSRARRQCRRPHGQK